MKGLKRIRTKRGLSQDELAEKIGTSKQIVSRYECGAHSPHLDVIVKLVHALDCTFEDLISEDELVCVFEMKYMALRSRDILDHARIPCDGDPSKLTTPFTSDLK